MPVCLALVLGAVLGVVSPLAAQAPQRPAPGHPAAGWWRHVEVLADDSLKGRDAGTPGHESAARYIAAQFRAAGLQPAGNDGWFQRIAFVETRFGAAAPRHRHHGRGERLPRAALGASLRAALPVERRAFTSPNVVGLLPGTDPALRGEVVVYSAHSDHVGTVTGAVLTGDSIFNGAMDNASGTATLIETARAVAARGGNRRTLLFVAVTAEEKGLLGSRYSAAHPTFGALGGRSWRT